MPSRKKSLFERMSEMARAYPPPPPAPSPSRRLDDAISADEEAAAALRPTLSEGQKAVLRNLSVWSWRPLEFPWREEEVAALEQAKAIVRGDARWIAKLLPIGLILQRML